MQARIIEVGHHAISDVNDSAIGIALEAVFVEPERACAGTGKKTILLAYEAPVAIVLLLQLRDETSTDERSIHARLSDGPALTPAPLRILILGQADTALEWTSNARQE